MNQAATFAENLWLLSDEVSLFLWLLILKIFGILVEASRWFIDCHFKWFHFASIVFRLLLQVVLVNPASV